MRVLKVDLQARRMDDLAALLTEHMQAWEATLTQASTLMNALKESTDREDKARSELVTVTAALVKISDVAQRQISALEAATEDED